MELGLLDLCLVVVFEGTWVLMWFCGLTLVDLFYGALFAAVVL